MIWHLTRFPGGGAGQYALRLSSALRAAGVASSVLVAEGNIQEGINKLEPVPSLWRRFFTRGWVSLLNRASVATYHTGFRLNRWQAGAPIQSGDIVHLQGMTGWIGFAGLEALIPQEARVFWTAHDLWPLSGGCVVYNGCEKYQHGCPRCPILRSPAKRLSRLEFCRKKRFIQNRRVTPIANSRWSADRIRGSAMFPQATEVPIVPPIVADAFFHQTPTNDVRQQVGVAQDRHVIGLGARVLTDTCKGIPEFLEQLSQHAQLASRVSVLLFGEGRLPSVFGLDCRFLGPVNEPRRLSEIYRACDVFVTPSKMETFGMTLLEAQACGTPVAGFRVGGTPEAIFPSNAHCLVALNDFNALLNCLVAMLKGHPVAEPRNREAAAWVKTHFSANVVAGIQRRIYETL